MTRDTAEVKADYHVKLEVRTRTPSIRPPQPIPLEQRLAKPGMFLVEQGADQMQIIVHRSRDLQIHRTPVLMDTHGKLYVDRPSWTPVHMDHYEDMDALVAALIRLNLTRVG